MSQVLTQQEVDDVLRMMGGQHVTELTHAELLSHNEAIIRAAKARNLNAIIDIFNKVPELLTRFHKIPEYLQRELYRRNSKKFMNYIRKDNLCSALKFTAL